MQVAVQFIAKVPVKTTKRRNWILASCPILDVHSQGDTVVQAKKNLAEALSLFFISCFERGTLDIVLKECGFRAVQPLPVKTKRPIVEQKDYIKVPIPFLVNQAGNECDA